MPIQYHPSRGTLLFCDFDNTFKTPEMIKRRPVIVISPPIKGRSGLCTVVCCSTTMPKTTMPYHAQIHLHEPLPVPLSSSFWIKGDMIYTVSFQRLSLIRAGKDTSGQRKYYSTILTDDQLRTVSACILHGLNLSFLTKHL